MVLVTVGPVAKVAYLDSSETAAFREVCIVAKSGKVLRFNNLLLASVSPMFLNVLSDHYSSPNYSSGDPVFISTEFEVKDLQQLHSLCHYGQILLESEDEQPSLSHMAVDLGELNLSHQVIKKITICCTFLENVQFAENLFF